MTADLLRTPLHDWHAAHDARLVDFAGWQMPVQYDSIVSEHLATRDGVGLFDVSHMGRFRLTGNAAAQLLDRLLTRRVEGMPIGQIRYSTITNEQGGILDDVLVYHLQDGDQPPFYGLVVNASNRRKIWDWLHDHRDEDVEVDVEDRTCATAMIAVQGPHALQTVQPLVQPSLNKISYYHGQMTSIDATHGVVSRTGYTGEDGCELIVPAEHGLAVWEKLLSLGERWGARAAGLGARDTLRLEAAMPLYGHELSEQIDPYQAGLGFAVNLKDRQFVGREALMRAKAEPQRLKRVGLKLAGRRVPREHYSVWLGEQMVGEITSGTFSPSLECPIAMAYVQPIAAEIGTEVAVDVRGRREPATIVKLPFYSRTP